MTPEINPERSRVQGQRMAAAKAPCGSAARSCGGQGGAATTARRIAALARPPFGGRRDLETVLYHQRVSLTHPPGRTSLGARPATGANSHRQQSSPTVIVKGRWYVRCGQVFIHPVFNNQVFI